MSQRTQRRAHIDIGGPADGVGGALVFRLSGCSYAQIAHRLPEDSVPRLMFDRALGSYDQFAGRLLENPGVTQRGNDRIARAGEIADAVTLEREAAQRREAAAAAARDGHSAAAEKARRADQRAADGLREAQDIEREGKKAAGDARSIATRTKDQADARAHDRAGAIEDDLEHTEAAANTLSGSRTSDET